MITKEQKKQVVRALIEQGELYESAAKQAMALGIKAAQMSRIKSGELDRVLSDANRIIIAGKLGVNFTAGKPWKTAVTPVYEFITEQLTMCKDKSVSGVLCDLTDIGKTHTAKLFVRKNRFSVYVDCSQVKSKQLLIRKIAREFGIDSTGRYIDVYESLVYYLAGIERPLVILDEAGDLKPDAFLELKALWNATERKCGWYMMGADGLRVKIERSIDYKKVGAAEIFRRYGGRFQQASPEGRDPLEGFKKKQFELVAKANGLEDIRMLYRKSKGSLERARVEFEKQHSA